MTVYVATKTMAAIEDAIRADQGASFRHWEGQVLPHIGDAYRGKEDGFRSHLGASVLGTPCARQLFYGWRWALKPLFNGKTLRLFNRGHLEEGRFIAMLLMIGYTVYQQDSEGKQFKISFASGHGGGSGDGVAMGVLDVPGDFPCLLEFKTHGEKSFIKLAGVAVEKDGYITYPGVVGVKEAKPEHYVQMCVYMKQMNLKYALYGAVNKNTDHIYMEIVCADDAIAERFMDRGEKVIYADTPPPKISPYATSFNCMWCDFKDVCHYGSAPHKNCRTCVFSVPCANNKTWQCKKHHNTISDEVMQVGCPDYSKAPYYGPK